MQLLAAPVTLGDFSVHDGARGPDSQAAMDALAGLIIRRFDVDG
jgi:hypothetical protein